MTKTLKPEYDELLRDWKNDSQGCSCHISPPCNHCMHEGHPFNLTETPEAWEDDGDGTAEDEVHSYA